MLLSQYALFGITSFAHLVSTLSLSSPEPQTDSSLWEILSIGLLVVEASDSAFKALNRAWDLFVLAC